MLADKRVSRRSDGKAPLNMGHYDVVEDTGGGSKPSGCLFGGWIPCYCVDFSKGNVGVYWNFDPFTLTN